MNTPKGYVALTSCVSGKAFLIDARGMAFFPGNGTTRGSHKLPANCRLASMHEDAIEFDIAETVDEVCAKLAAALGEQTPPAAPALHDLERAVVDTGLSWERDPGSLDLTQAHIAALRALRAARGGATPGAAP